MAKANDLKALQTLAAPFLERYRRNDPTLRAREKKHVQRYLDALDDQKREEHYRTVPKKHLCELAGRQHKQLDDAYRTYGVPCRGETVDLYVLQKWWFDFLATNGRKLLKAEDGDDLLSGPETPELEKLRKVNRLIKEVEYGKLKTQVLDRTKVHDGLTQIAAQFRDFGDVLQRRFGPDALDLLHQRLDSIEAIIAALCAKPDEENSAELPE